MWLRRHPLDAGRRFGRVIVIQDLGSRGTANHEKSYSRVRCDCGNEFEVRNYSLLCGHTKSCGCLKREMDRVKGQRALLRMQGSQYGSPCVPWDGSVIVRSMQEMIFYTIMGGEEKVKYEPETVTLVDGSFYTYDFAMRHDTIIYGRDGEQIILPAGAPIELKPTRNWWG